MNRTDFIRFALVLSDGQATTFKKNLTKIIKLVLFDCFGTSLIIGEIAKRIKESYSLEFSDAEINNALKNDRTHIFVETRPSKDPVNFNYTITPLEYDKLKQKDTSDHFDDIAKRFVADCCRDCGFSLELIKNIVLRYIYFVFNTDINTVLSLMDYEGNRLIQDIPNENFTHEEKLLLNSFLNWADKEKNRFIYNVISACYEYCMMTVKKDNSSYASIFNGKEFYLDSNVIFRLAGFNQNERREVVESFIRKCNECGIKIEYTNFTIIEIDSTLKYQVGLIRKLLNGQSPICIEAVKSMSSKYANLDFYSTYIDWLKKPGHEPNDYAAFLKYLKREVDKHIRQMTFIPFESYEKKSDNAEFVRLCENFTVFKEKRAKDTYEGSIKVDIENYLYMRRLDSEVKYNSFLEKKHYFITTDHSYVEWAKEKTPGAIPTIVLPSVWYSLMLKYKGRTDNDYNAFCQFLNLRIYSHEDDELVEKKEQMLAYVLSIDESPQIKEEIIFDINSRLLEDTDEITDIEAFVEESHTRITEHKVIVAVSEAEKDHLAEKEALQEAAKQEAQNEHNVGYEKGIDVGLSNGVERGIDQVIHSQAIRKVSRNRNIRIVSLCIGIILIVAFVALFILASIKGNNKDVLSALKFMNDNSAIIAIVTFSVSVISLFISQLNKCVDILSLDVEKVERKIKNRYIKQMRDSNQQCTF